MMQVDYRQLTIQDRPRLLELFERVPPTIARMSNRLVCNAIVDDALRSTHVVIFVASLDKDLVGYVIVAWNWSTFKRLFVLRHPFVGLLAVAKRLRAGLERHGASAHDLGQGDAVAAKTVGGCNRTPAWNDSARTIAKLIYIGIDPQVRSMGLGCGLCAHLIAHFKQRGFTRIDSHVDSDNLASVHMFKKAGCEVIEDGSGFLAFFEMSREGLDSNE